jgi:hypothetical protein
VTQFVDECRQEWKRLGVPDPAANEMAADLEADLEEAASEGISAEEVLGAGAFDPRSFAASWAFERGLIPPIQPEPVSLLPPPVEAKPRQTRTLSLVSIFTGLVLVGIALTQAGAHQAVAMSPFVMQKPFPFPRFPLAPPGASPQIIQTIVRVNPFYAVGPLMLLAGLVGLITILVLWLWRRLHVPVATA